MYAQGTSRELNTRFDAEPDNAGLDNDENDYVELEKSNVLLLGPTGSGLPFLFISIIIIYLLIWCQ